MRMNVSCVRSSARASSFSRWRRNRHTCAWYPRTISPNAAWSCSAAALITRGSGSCTRTPRGASAAILPGDDRRRPRVRWSYPEAPDASELCDGETPRHCWAWPLDSHLLPADRHEVDRIAHRVGVHFPLAQRLSFARAIAAIPLRPSRTVTKNAGRSQVADPRPPELAPVAGRPRDLSIRVDPDEDHSTDQIAHPFRAGRVAID